MAKIRITLKTNVPLVKIKLSIEVQPPLTVTQQSHIVNSLSKFCVETTLDYIFVIERGSSCLGFVNKSIKYFSASLSLSCMNYEILTWILLTTCIILFLAFFTLLGICYQQQRRMKFKNSSTTPSIFTLYSPATTNNESRQIPPQNNTQISPRNSQIPHHQNSQIYAHHPQNSQIYPHISTNPTKYL